MHWRTRAGRWVVHPTMASRLAVAVLASAAMLAITPARAHAHAALVSTEPAADERLEAAPERVVLRFTEPVQVEDDGVVVYGRSAETIEASPPEHPDGEGSAVAVNLPVIEQGAYLVSWRVLSSDGHPVSGAFTFLVGDAATEADAAALMDELAGGDGDRPLGVVYGVARFAAFAGMVLLVGGAAFLLALWPAGLADSRARRVMAVAWSVLVVATVASIGLQGAYASGLSLGDAVDPSVIRNELGERTGQLWLLRLLLLSLVAAAGALHLRRVTGAAATAPRVALGTRATDLSAAADDSALAAGVRPRTPEDVLYVAAVLGLAVLATASLTGHATTGDLVPLAVVVDLAHLSAISVWLGGLVLLVGVLLRRRAGAPAEPTEVARVAGHFSSVAFGAVVVIVATGVLQSWRQVRGLEALTDTTFGRLLLVKAALFAAIIVAAAFSRSWVRGHLARAAAPSADVALNGADDPPATQETEAAERDTPAERGTLAPSTPRDEAVPTGRETGAVYRCLRRSVGAEVALAAVVLAVTAVLVNAAPAETAYGGGGGGTFSTELHGSHVFVTATVDPAAVGVSTVDLRITSHDGTPLDPEEATASFSLPERDLGPLDLTLERVGTGHYVSEEARLQFPGDWELEVVVRTSDIDQDRLTAPFTVE